MVQTSSSELQNFKYFAEPQGAGFNFQTKTMRKFVLLSRDLVLYRHTKFYANFVSLFATQNFAQRPILGSFKSYYQLQNISPSSSKFLECFQKHGFCETSPRHHISPLFKNQSTVPPLSVRVSLSLYCSPNVQPNTVQGDSRDSD